MFGISLIRDDKGEEEISVFKKYRLWDVDITKEEKDTAHEEVKHGTHDFYEDIRDKKYQPTDLPFIIKGLRKTAKRLAIEYQTEGLLDKRIEQYGDLSEKQKVYLVYALMIIEDDDFRKGNRFSSISKFFSRKPC